MFESFVIAKKSCRFFTIIVLPAPLVTQACNQIVSSRFCSDRRAFKHIRTFIYCLSLFQVGWIKADTKAIQAIAMHVITNNPRVSVSHDELRAKFRLHIAGATLEDAGPYMCQINSMPVVKQVSISVYLPLYSFTWNASNAFSFVYTTC